jgi:hypothetical protein
MSQASQTCYFKCVCHISSINVSIPRYNLLFSWNNISHRCTDIFLNHGPLWRREPQCLMCGRSGAPNVALHDIGLSAIFPVARSSPHATLRALPVTGSEPGAISPAPGSFLAVACALYFVISDQQNLRCRGRPQGLAGDVSGRGGSQRRREPGQEAIRRGG